MKNDERRINIATEILKALIGVKLSMDIEGLVEESYGFADELLRQENISLNHVFGDKEPL